AGLRLSGGVPEVIDPGERGAAGAAVHLALLLQTMADDPAAAVAALRRQRVNRAFEAVEDVRDAVGQHLECLVVLVSTDLADGDGHRRSSRQSRATCTHRTSAQ